MDRLSKNRATFWSDGLAILASVSAIGFAVWGAPIMASDADEYIGGSSGPFARLGWLAFGLAGALGLAGVFLAQRRGARRLGQGLLAAGGVVMLVALVTMRQFDGYAIATKLLPGLIMLGTAPFLGPMAEPNDPADDGR